MNYKKDIFSIISMIVAIVLMTMPIGVAMEFSSGPGSADFVTKYYSYFSGMPIGYANWLPLITVLISIFILLMLIVDIKVQRMRKVIKFSLSICIIASVLSWIIFDSFTIIALLIMIIHIVVLILQVLTKNNQKTN